MPAPRRARSGRGAARGGRRDRRGGRRRGGAGRRTRSGGIGSHAKSQMTVRNFHCAWNDTPWSMPKMSPLSVARRQCPPLRSVLLITMSNAAMRRNSSPCSREQREVVLLGIVMDESLHHPDARRAVAQHGVGHDLPTQRLRHLSSRDLAVAQRAAREVPQRAFAALRLVDREQLIGAEREAHEKRGVRRPRHPAEHLDFAVAQHRARGVLVERLDLRANPTRRPRSPCVLSSSAGRCARRDPSGTRTAGTSAGRPTPRRCRSRASPGSARASRTAARCALRSPRRRGGGSSSSAACSRSSNNTSDRSGSKPMPISRARKSGSSSSTVPPVASSPNVPGSSGCSSAMRSRNCSASAASNATCSFSTSTDSTACPCAPGSRRCARRAGRTRPRRSRRPDRTRSRRSWRRLGFGLPARSGSGTRSARPPVSLHFTSSAP